MDNYDNNYPEQPQDGAYNAVLSTAYESHRTNELLEQIVREQQNIIKNQQKQEKQHKALISYGSIIALFAVLQIIIWVLQVLGIIRIFGV